MPTCTQCQKSFQIHPDEVAFLKKMDFKFGNTTIPLPEPTACADCRSQQRTAHRNEQCLYQRKSDLSGKQLISLYPNEAAWGAPYKVYSPEEWWSDQWDALEYGRDFDFSRPFFEQFAELQKAVPRIALISMGNENSPFTTGTGYCKNCHLINSSENCEDCYYGKLLQKSRDSVDCSYLYDSERCYECFSVYNSYNCVHLSYGQNCSDCYFSENLSGCKNCFLCTNLSGKEYYFFNKPLEKEEYQKKVKEFMGSHANFQKAKEILAKLRLERVHKYANNTNCENSTGDFLQNTQNCFNSYDVNDSQDCRNVLVGVNVKDCYDCSNVYLKPELCYQFMGSIEAYHIAYSLYVFHSQNVLYSEHIYNSSNCFGCEGLHKKEYCILNKQYTKEEYEKLVPKIIEHIKKTGEWGQFFPTKYSAHAYNESLSSEYFPLTQEEVKKRGWNWHEDRTQAAYQGAKVTLPDHIKDAPEDTTDKILTCEATGKLYKIIPQELKFYRSLQIPLPHHSPDQRHKDRMKLRNPRTLWDRACQKCQKPIQTTYAPERPEKIYCEECYLREVY